MQPNRESGFYRPRIFLVFVLGFCSVLLALIGVGAPTPAATRPEPASSFKPVVSRSSLNSVSIAVRDLPTGPAAAPRTIERDEGLRKIRPNRPVSPTFVDSVLQSVIAPAPLAPLAMPAPLATFEGLNSTQACDGCIPPDTTGAVGPTQFVQMVNSSFAVYSKAGALLAGPAQINSLFAGLPGTACANNNNGDPVVIYDRMADRWMLSQFAVPGGTVGYHECIAVSKTGDATGEYYLYDFLLNPPSPEKFQDYPHFGLWPDAYYMSTHQFDPDNYIGAGAFAFEREKMLSGQPAQMVYFDLNNANPAFGGHLPANVDGPGMPPAGAPGIFAEVDPAADFPATGAALRLWKFHVDWANPGNSTFGLDGQPNTITPIEDFARPACVAQNYSAGCIPQKGDSFQLDPIGDRLMARLVYRNFGDHESLLLNHTVVADGNTLQHGPRWYEVRDPGGAPVIFQQGTFGPTGPTDLLHRWMGSIAMDGSGDIAIGYNTSSNADFPSIAYAGRLSTDPINILAQGEAQMFPGSGPQHGELFAPSFGRWGDYSGMTVDPADDCTFWYTTEYYDSVDELFGVWHTRIGTFKFPSCVATTPSPTPTATVSSETPTPTPTPTATSTPIASPSGTPNPCGTPITFINSGSITLVDNSKAVPYPATIGAFVEASTVSKVTATINGLTHNYPDDTGLLLVGPTGVKVRLMTDAGGGGTGFSVSNVTMTFDDAATLSVPDEGPITAGSYKPTQGAVNVLSGAHAANFPAPAPASPYANLLSSFNGTNPNGTWSLYADDDTEIDGGTIQGGWSLTITTVCSSGSPTPTATASPTPTPTATATAAATPTATVTATPTATPSGTPTASPSAGPDADCLNAPIVVLTDPAGDQGAGRPAEADIISVSAGEDYSYINTQRLVFVLKVNSNLGTIPPNQTWKVRWTFNATSYYVAMSSDMNSNLSYDYGTQSGNLLMSLGTPDSVSHDTQGNIKFLLAMSKVRSPVAGSVLTAVNGLTQLSAAGAGSGEDSTSSADYTVRAQSGACVPIPLPVTGNTTYLKGGMTFSPNYTTRAPYIGQDVEPSVRCDKYGNCYVAAIRGVPGGTDLWYFDLRPTVPDPNTPGASIANRNYDPFMRNPQYRGQPDKIGPVDCGVDPDACNGSVGSDGGGDVDIAVGMPSAALEDTAAPPTLAYTSLAVGNISTQRSTDRGDTFVQNPIGNASGGVPGDDRQWLEFLGPNTVYLFYRTLEPAISQVQRSVDGGLTYGNAATAGAVGQAGGIAVDQNDGTVYISGSNGSVSVGVPPAAGLPPITYTTHNVTGGGNAHLFFTVKVAADGTVYVCYSDDVNVYIRFSTDKGNTWSAPIRVNDGPETKTAVFPWMTTGPVSGTIGVVWYGSDKLSTMDDTADWNVFYALGTDVKGNAVFRQAKASDHVIHASNISENGLDPTGTNPPNRNLADYFQVAFDPTGAAVVGYCDDHNDLSGHTFVTRQISGPGALGMDIPTPVEGTAVPPAPNEPLPRAADVGGIPGSQVTDFDKDVRLGGNPQTGGTAVIPVNDPLDIVSILYSAEPTSAVDSAPLLVATMKVSDLTTLPPSSNWRSTFTANAPDSVLSPTNEYTFGVSDRGDGFFVRATTDAQGGQTFVYGTAARAHNGSITYTDKGAADCGFFDAPSKTITIKVALSKVNAAMASGRPQITTGSVLVGLRGSTFTTAGSGATGNNKADTARGGTQYAVAVGSLTACSGTAPPTPTPTPTATATAAATASPTPTATATPTATPPTLGEYPNATVVVSENANVTPDAPPTGATSINISTDSNFRGTFAANPGTGVVRVTNAHPVGTYTVTVRAFNSGGVTSKTFTLTVINGTACNDTVQFTSGANVSSGAQPSGIAIGDFNNDGNQDFITSNVSGNTVSVRLGDGAGGFSGITEISVGGLPNIVAVGDFNNDGNLDFATANANDNTVSIRLGDGSGGFSGTTEVSVGAFPESVAIGDFNNDGNQDLATANFSSDTVSIRLGDGLGGFSGSTEISVGVQPISVAIGDFNGDGKQDLACATNSTQTVSIRLGDGMGGFSGSTEIPVGVNPFVLVIGEFNNDGKQDLAVTNYGSATVSIRLGDGMGGFSGTTEVSVASRPVGLALGDFNSDGNQDLAVANQKSNTVSVRFGDGSGGFSGTTDLNVNSIPTGIAIGDFNEDHKQDFAVTSGGFDRVNIRLSDCVVASQTPTPTPTATPETSPTPTATATATVEPTATATATSTPAPTATATATSTSTPTATVAPTATATATSTSTPTATVAPTATATATPAVAPSATATATANPTATATATPTVTAMPAQLLNISTRANVLTGDNILIGGFIINGNDAKKVLLLAKGPSISVNGTPLPGRMLNPILELHRSDGSLVTSNDDWKDSPERAQIEASGAAPTDDRESAIIRTLLPGTYTGVLAGEDNTSGIALVEVYDLDANKSILANISSRGRVDTGDNVMIGGFIAGNQSGNTKILVRGLGPSLEGQVPDPLADPILELHDANGNTLESNDNWKDAPNRTEIEGTGIPPSRDLESAILRAVNPSGYTAILRGKTGAGVAVVEIYNLQ